MLQYGCIWSILIISTTATMVTLNPSAAGVKEFDSKADLLVIAAVSEDTDPFRRFTRSVQWNGIAFMPMEVPRGLPNEQGNWKATLGILRHAISKLKNSSTAVLFTDGYNSIINGDSATILELFAKCKCHVLFAAGDICSPSEVLQIVEHQDESESFCVHPSAGFIGRADSLHELFSRQPEVTDSTDRAYFTRLLRNELQLTEAAAATTGPQSEDAWLGSDTCEVLTSSASASAAPGQIPSIVSWPNSTAHTHKSQVMTPLNLKLDTNNKLFQSLEGSMSRLELVFTEKSGILINRVTGTSPLVIHGSGPAKVHLNSFGNYLVGHWTPAGGCLGCGDDYVTVPSNDDGGRTHYPVTFAALFAEKVTPFLSSFYEHFEKLEYPHRNIDLFVFNEEPYNDAATKAFIQRATGKYRSVRYLSDKVGIRAARNIAVAECLKTECEYFFSLDSEAQLTRPSTISYLIGQNRSIVAPLLLRPGRLWSNFWGALSSDGYYARSDDYMDIVSYRRIGIWNVPYVSGAVLVKGHSLRRMTLKPYNHGRDMDDEKMSFCANARDQGIFMYLDNRFIFGHLVNTDDFDSTLVSPELYELFSNTAEWRRKYLHQNYSQILEGGLLHVEEPCPDVYWFPMMSEAFCDELVALMESFGQWSSGSNNDSRLKSGYESVPTRDIHMNQVNYERHWLTILQHYVQPIQRLIFTGYQSANKALLNFVVRYRPDEQPSLRPHHDTSTFTINMALNTPGVDYEGGGVRFIRYNCTVRDLRKGWMLMHPGRLTHYHEGLATTNGTRYIMVSFVDP